MVICNQLPPPLLDTTKDTDKLYDCVLLKTHYSLTFLVSNLSKADILKCINMKVTALGHFSGPILVVMMSLK